MIKSFPVVMFLEDGSHKVLGVYESYDDADNAVDKYCELYPNAYIDMLVG